MTKGTEMIISGLISKIINNCVDFSWKKIKEADKNRKSYEQNIETRIYQVTVDAINVCLGNIYEGKDITYDAAERILKGFKSKKEYRDVIKSGLRIMTSRVTDAMCDNFLKVLQYEICKDENDILYKEIVLIQQEKIIKEIEKSNQHQNHVLELLDYVKEDTSFIREVVSSKKNQEREHREIIPVNNRAKEYARKWNENMFLNDFSEFDEYAGVNVKLREIYLEGHLPHFIWKTNDNSSNNLKELLKKYVVDNDGKKMLLILGLPGIGKSTLITWITANLKEKEDEILVYQFASDLKNINWQSENVLDEIFIKLGLEYNELDGKTLILDGFDEMRISEGREKILNQLYQELKENNLFKTFSLIITSRENYVYELQKVECDYITLKTWDADQIRSFCGIYSAKIGKKISKNTIRKILEKEEVFGTPLILYMVLALNITIEDNGSIVDVYDRIFSLDGGSIYDRCIRNSRFAAPHRISEDKIKQQIHEISKKIAFWMFENRSEEANIPQKEYERICNNVINETTDGIEDVKHDFLIGNYFKLIKHCEGLGTGELQFVHRSIYEYFVVIYFCESIYDKKSTEDIMGQLGVLLKEGHLSEEILKYIKYKFNQKSKYDMPKITKNIFQKMLQDGMTYHTEQRYNKIIDREINIFSNMLEIVRLWNDDLGELNDNVISYLSHNNRSKLNLKGVKLGSVNLHRVYLEESNLNEAHLEEANLKGADLRGACLREAYLDKADLEEANLKEADLIGAYLREANLCEAKLIRSDLSGVDLISAKLIGANLCEADLLRTKLVKADLRRANLNRAKLNYAELYGADLREAQLYGIDLSGAYLKGVIFDEKQVTLLNEKYLNNSKIYIFETEEIISYSEYCTRRQHM